MRAEPSRGRAAGGRRAKCGQLGGAGEAQPGKRLGQWASRMQMSRPRRANGGGGCSPQRDWLAPGGGGAGRGWARPRSGAAPRRRPRPGPALPRGLAVPGGCSRGPAAPGRAPPAGQGTQAQSRRERSGQRGSPFSLARPVRGHSVRVVADTRSARPWPPGVLLRSGGAALCAAGCAGAAWL